MGLERVSARGRAIVFEAHQRSIQKLKSMIDRQIDRETITIVVVAVVIVAVAVAIDADVSMSACVCLFVCDAGRKTNMQ